MLFKMLHILILHSILLSVIHCGPSNVTMRYFETKLDHFGMAPGQTFTMRYLIDDSYFLDASKDKEPKPILFYAGNEGDIY